jgi:hypothetical protein
MKVLKNRRFSHFSCTCYDFLPCYAKFFKVRLMLLCKPVREDFMKKTLGVILATVAGFLFAITLAVPAEAMEFGARGF